MTRRRIWMTAGIVLLALALLLQQRPLRLPSEGPREPASVPWGDRGHGTLLILDDDLGKRRGAGDGLEWANLLRQTFGGADAAPASALLARPDSVLAGRSLVVLPRATLSGLPLEAAEILDRRVARGGLAVLTEAPDTAWARRLGLRTAALEWQERWPWPFEPRAPGLGGPPLPPPVRDLELRWTVSRFAPHPAVHPRTLPTCRIGARPAVWRRPVGEGAWTVLAMDLGALARRVRQGWAPDDGAARSGPHTFDRAASPDLRGRGEPWLDAWVAALLAPENAATPWPRLAPLPFDDDGWLVLGADRPRGSGTAPRGDLPVTSYLPPPTGSTDVATGADAAETGLRWTWPSDRLWREGSPLRERVGVGPFRPLGRLPTVAEQARRTVAAGHGSTPPIHGRSEALVWPRETDAAFEELEALGLRSDSSFGPPVGEVGWLFGSAFPHHPLDRRGRAFGIWEVPFVASVGPDGPDPERLRPLLDWNRLGPRGPLALRLSAGARSSQVAGETAALARAAGHRIVSLSTLLDWWEERGEASLHWRWEEPELVVRLEDAPSDAGRHLGILLPRRWHGRSLATWTSEPPGANARTVWHFDSELLLIEVVGASTTLRVRYPAGR